MGPKQKKKKKEKKTFSYKLWIHIRGIKIEYERTFIHTYIHNSSVFGNVYKWFTDLKVSFLISSPGPSDRSWWMMAVDSTCC